LAIGVPGVKLGLSNIAVMYALFLLDKKQAFTIAALKAVFVFVTRGLTAGILSFCGGMLSILVMLLLILIFKDSISYLILSIFGAVAHNLGQITAISVIYTNIALWVYLPVLLIAGVVAGIATSTLLRFILPAFRRAGLK
jgi:heptaprenyl diphosphate synthase